MPHKDFRLDEQLQVSVYKRRGNRSMRLTVAPNGQVRLSIPAWVRYDAGLAFARSRLAWIRANLPATPAALVEGQAIGKAHRLRFVAGPVDTPRSRVRLAEVVVTHPPQLSSDDPLVQQLAASAGIRALRAQAEQLLPQRLKSLADQHDFSYKSVRIKQLKGRWGSCDAQQNIVLNLFLMQLPWDLIDYVLLHELAHTRVLRHGPDFWAVLQDILPAAKQQRKRIRSYQPLLAASTLE